MYHFLMKEMHFSQQVTNIGTRRLVSNHRQRVCYRMVDSVCRSDAQVAGVTPPWNTLYNKHFNHFFEILAQHLPDGGGSPILFFVPSACERKNPLGSNASALRSMATPPSPHIGTVRIPLRVNDAWRSHAQVTNLMLLPLFRNAEARRETSGKRSDRDGMTISECLCRRNDHRFNWHG
jgi:hypothetical protein